MYVDIYTNQYITRHTHPLGTGAGERWDVLGADGADQALLQVRDADQVGRLRGVRPCPYPSNPKPLTEHATSPKPWAMNPKH